VIWLILLDAITVLDGLGRRHPCQTCVCYRTEIQRANAPHGGSIPPVVPLKLPGGFQLRNGPTCTRLHAGFQGVFGCLLSPPLRSWGDCWAPRVTLRWPKAREAKAWMLT
jgi:hypothetical protein